jgi:hypothetical protein
MVVDDIKRDLSAKRDSTKAKELAQLLMRYEEILNIKIEMLKKISYEDKYIELGGLPRYSRLIKESLLLRDELSFCDGRRIYSYLSMQVHPNFVGLSLQKEPYTDGNVKNLDYYNEIIDLYLKLIMFKYRDVEYNIQ